MQLILPFLLVIFGAPFSAHAQQSPADAPAYVGSETCTACHRVAAAAWAGSHHALAWTEASPRTVVADFEGTEFAHDGTLTKFRVEDGGYFATVTEKDGSMIDYRVHSVAGIAPLQQYLLETEPGRLQSFDVVWDTENKRWYHLYPDQDLPPNDGLHWTGPYKNWNGRCAECHATGFEKKYSPATQTYRSTQAEIGVGCEACHGPGEAHLAWANDEEIESPFTGLTETGLTMDFSGDTPEATIQQCAGCHSRREAYGDGNPLPGTPYHDAYRLSTLRPVLYHSDGQILDEVYVYGSFLQSKMYARGVGCSNCHNAHTARLKAEGNAVCTQCHAPSGNPDFPTLKSKAYDDPTHHFHEAGSPGAQCKSCHMIERVYMGIDGRRDHSFRIPRPDLFNETGAPDACSDCHKDQSPAWAAAQIAEWYPDNANRRPHYGQIFAPARNGEVGETASLIALAEDGDQAGIVRATALWLLEQSADAKIASRLSPLISSPDPLVRAAAIGVQRAAPPQDQVSRIVPGLSDPVRSVRIAAAKQMHDAPIARLPQRISKEMREAMNEWQGALANQTDFPETHMVLGGLALTMRNLPAATGAFREVTKLDPQLIEAWVMLARITAVTEGAEAASSILIEALEIIPGDKTLQAILGELSNHQ